jgi:multiple sugar transport system substrate-binding protein
MTQSASQWPSYVAVGLGAALLLAAPAAAQSFDWKAHKGVTVLFLANNQPWTNAVLKYKAEFEALTGITLKVDSYQEQQMRQRLLTVMNARSDEIDVFMTLPSREGMQFAASGWYLDLKPLIAKGVAPGYDFADLSPALVEAATFEGQLTGIPLNIEGPLLYYRTDILEKCKIAPPATIDDLVAAAKVIKTCAPDVTPFASRGLKPAIGYTFSAFLHNMGGSYMTNGRSSMCAPASKKALETYGGLLRDYGPPGVVNASFYQLTSLYRAGRSALSFESSNEFASVMEGGARLKDTGILPLPKGAGGSHPTAIGWALSVSKHTRNAGAAWYFVQWATSPEMQVRLALEGIAPPRSAAANAPEYRKWLDQEPIRRQWQAAIDVLTKDGTSEVGYPIIQNAASREYIGQAVNDILLGTRSLDDACAEADRQMNALIDQK